MALAYEGNTDLAFDTDALRKCGNRYSEVAKRLEDLATTLTQNLAQLRDEGWTTPAGTAFETMVNEDWKENVDKYVDLLETLDQILDEAAMYYENLEDSYIETTKLQA